MINIGLEQQQRIMGATGDILWSGAQVIATSYIAKNSTVTAAPAILMGEGVIWDPATVAAIDLGNIPRQETTIAPASPSSDLPETLNLVVRRSLAAATDGPYLGVAQEPIGVSSAGASGTLTASTTFKQGLVAGMGSLTSVKTTATAIVLGQSVGSSATIGLVADNATEGCILGTCFKINTGTPETPGTGTGSTGWAGILVNPR